MVLFYFIAAWPCCLLSLIAPVYKCTCQLRISDEVDSGHESLCQPSCIWGWFTYSLTHPTITSSTVGTINTYVDGNLIVTHVSCCPPTVLESKPLGSSEFLLVFQESLVFRNNSSYKGAIAFFPPWRLLSFCNCRLLLFK